MNWEAIGAVGEVAGAVGVIVTLGYLAAQIRQNSRVVRSSTRQAISNAQSDYGIKIVSNPEMRASAYRWLHAEPAPSMTEEAFGDEIYVRTLLRMYENQYHQYRDGTFDEAMWSGYAENMDRNFARPAFAAWWRENRSLYSTGFASFVDARVEALGADPSPP